MTNFSQSLQQNNKKLFDLAHSVDDCGRSLLEEFNKRELRLFDLPAYQRIFLFVVSRSIKTYASILILCEQGYGQDVSTLLRSLFENLVTTKYIIHDKQSANNLAKRFVAYKWVVFKRHLAEQEKQIESASPDEKNNFLKRKKMILDKVDEFKKEFHIISDQALVTWSGKAIRDMAKQVDKNLLEEYEITFRLCSRFSHPSILGDNEYMVQDDKHIIFSPLPSDIGVVVNLENAIKYILEFLRIINTLFSFGYEKPLESLTSNLEKILQSKKYQPETPQSAATIQSNQKSTSIRESIIKFKMRLS